MTRRENDFYPTLDNSVIGRLMKHWDVPKHASILEPCAGELHLVKQLQELGYINIFYRDIAIPTHYMDASKYTSWLGHNKKYTITNPPFNLAHKIIPLAYENSRDGIAMLLRLSYLEPCKNRAVWLAEHPISKLISIPRISFTGDGKSDFVATAWFVWDKRTDEQEIVVSP